MDATEFAVLDHLQDNGKKKDLSGVEKQRDVLKSAVIKEDDKAAILSFVQNYQIHLIDPAKLSTSLREVLGYIKYSKDKEQLLKFIDNNPRMRMEAGAAKVIQAVTNTKIEIPENAEVVDVCKAVEDLMEDSRQEGRKQGQIETLAGLVLDGKLDIKIAVASSGMTEQEFEAEMEKMKR